MGLRRVRQGYCLRARTASTRMAGAAGCLDLDVRRHQCAHFIGFQLTPLAELKAG